MLPWWHKVTGRRIRSGDRWFAEGAGLRCAARIVGAILLMLVIAGVTAWAALALWYRLPAPQPARGVVGGAFVVCGLVTMVALFSRWRHVMLLSFVAAFAGVLVWWSTIEPAAHADWAPGVARQVTGTLDGDTLTLTDVRSFIWRSKSDFDERWKTRTYDLGKLRTLDLFMSYWGGHAMAHVMMSFGFEGGRYLTWSVEVRRRRNGEFSPVADLFKSDPLVIVAADEQDVIGVRSNFRGEDVQLYRLKAAPEVARPLLLEYVTDANRLAQTPQFYNSLTKNCAITVVKMMRAVGDKVPFDWQLIVDGYLPEYAYRHGALDTRLPLSELRARAHIDKRAQEAGLTDKFSRAIRVNVPSPLQP